MRLPPSVIALIESHLVVPSTVAKGAGARQAGLKALAQTLQPQPTTAPTGNGKSGARLSVRAALERYPRTTTIALSVVHRLLADHASEPSTSSRVSYLLRRQRIYERLIRTFTAYPSSEWVPIASLLQRMMDEGTPPNLDTLKIVISAAMRNGMPVLPILQRVIAMDGLPDQMDDHLLLLVVKGLVREGGMKAGALKAMLSDMRSEGTLSDFGSMNEVLVEAYGQEGDMRGILHTISHHRQNQKLPAISGINPMARSTILSLYLQALKQWTTNPALRRKRRGSLFPRILAKDVVDLYGGTDHLPLIWLNAWMNCERISGDTEAAMTIWRMIGDSADRVSYTTYFRLAKHIPTDDAELRSTIRSLLVLSGGRGDKGIAADTIDSAMSASFHHGDLPLCLLLARRLLGDVQRKGVDALRLGDRTIDLLASGIIRSQSRPLNQRPPSSKRSTETSARLPEFITQNEWDDISVQLNIENVSLPLSRPQARLSVEIRGQENTFIKTFLPERKGSKSAYKLRIMARLVEILEETVIQRFMHGRQSREGILKEVMSALHKQVLP